jgi:methionine-rich copper-binding protein CopC
MPVQRTIINAIASLALLFSAAAVAFAHAELPRAVPPVGGTVAAAPNEVTINFSEQLESAFSTVVVRDSAGKQVDKAGAHVDKDDRTIMRVSLQPLPPGTYTVKWRVVTVDTHRTEGTFTFSVGE